MKMLHFAAVAFLVGLTEAWVPSIPQVGSRILPPLSRLNSSPLSENLLGIALGDEFDVSIPADFDITDAKKAWPKRRRSASPLLVHVSLSEEAAVLGEGGGGVTTLLRVGKGELENLQLVAGSKLRAYVAEVKPGGAPGASTGPSNDDDDDGDVTSDTTTPPPTQLQEEDQPSSVQAATLILSCSRSYARGRGTTIGTTTKPAAATSASPDGSSSTATSRGHGPAPEGALLLSSLSPGDALEHCKVVKVLPSGALFASCGVVRPGKGGAWTHVDGFVFPGDLGDRAVAPGADALAFERTFGAGTLSAATKRAKANRQRIASDAKAEARLLAVEEALKQAKENGELSNDGDDDDDLDELEDLPMPPPASLSSPSRIDDYDAMAQLLNTNLKDADSALGVLNGPWRSVIDLWPGFDSSGLKGARNLQRLQSTFRGGSVAYFDHVVSKLPKAEVVIDEESGDAWLSFGDLLAALEEEFPGVRVTLKAVTGVMRRRAPIKGTVPKAPEPTKSQQVTFGGFILDNDGNAEAEDRADDDEGDEEELTSTDNEDGDEISEGPMLLFEEASLLPGSSSSSRMSSGSSGGGSGSLAKRQREATLLSPRPQARRMLQRFAALVQASGAADLAAASGARAKAEGLADEAAALAPTVLARGATLPGARVKSCSKQSGKLVLALDSSNGRSGSSSSSGGKRSSVGNNNKKKKMAGCKVKVVEVGQAVKGTVTKRGSVHLGPGLEAQLLIGSSDAVEPPKEGSVVDVVVCSALVQKGGAGQQTVRVALAGSDAAAAALEQTGSSSNIGGARSDARVEFDALLAASEVSAKAKYEGGNEDDDEDDEDDDDGDDDDGDDDDNAPMTVDDL